LKFEMEKSAFINNFYLPKFYFPKKLGKLTKTSIISHRINFMHALFKQKYINTFDYINCVQSF